MPRLTRKSLVDSPEPTRRSARAATHASSTSSQATPPAAAAPGRGRSRSKQGATGDAGEPEEKPTRGGRSQSRKKVEPAEEKVPTPIRGKKTKTPAKEPSSKKGKGKTPAKKGKNAAEVKDTPEAEDVPEVEDVPEDEAPEEAEDNKAAGDVQADEPVAPPVKERGRSRGRAKATPSPKPAVSPSPSGRGKRSKTTNPAATPSPARESPRGRRGRKSEPEEEEAKSTEAPTEEAESEKPETEITSAEPVPMETEEPVKSSPKPVKSSQEPVKTPEPVKSSPKPVKTPEPAKSSPVPVKTPEPAKSSPVPVKSSPVPVTTPEPVKSSPKPVKTPESVKSSPKPVQTPEPVKSSPNPVQTPEPIVTPKPAVASEPVTAPKPVVALEPISAPVVEPITPESDTEASIAPPVIEDISPMETEPSVPIPAVTAEADQTSSTGNKRKSRDEDDDVVESSAKRQHYGNEEQTNEAVPAQVADVEMSEEASVPKTQPQVQPTQSEPTRVVSQPTAQTSEAEAKPDLEDDFEMISHADVPSADSQEVQASVPVHKQPERDVPQVGSSGSINKTDRAPSQEVSTSEAVCNQSEVAPSSLLTNQGSMEGAVSSQMDEVPFRSTHNPMVEDVSPVESSMDSNIGSYGDDRDPIAPQASAADSNVSSQSTETPVIKKQETATSDATINEAIPNQTNSYNYQSISQQPDINQSEPVTSSQTSNSNSNGVGHIEKPTSQIKTIEPKIAPTSAYLSKYSKDIFHRHMLSNPLLSTPVDSKHQFSVVSYNILADCHLRRGDYSFTDETNLDQNNRHKLLVQELQYLDADVICLQEVNPEYYNNLLKPELESLGYKGDIFKRCQDYYNEGEATFYRTSRFALVDQMGFKLKDLAEKEILAGGLNDEVEKAVRQYLDKSDVVHISRLRCNNTGRVVTIGNIHVIYDSFQSPDIQSIQIASAIKELVSKAGNDTSPFLLCGDYNSEPGTAGYQLARDGYFSDSNIQKLQAIEKLEITDGSKSLVNHLWRAFQHTASNLKSAYNTVQGQEPVITSYVHSKHNLDYIFYNANSLDVSGVLQVVHEDVVSKTGGLPSSQFPSDHLSLKSVFNIKE